ncbi:POU-specific domain and Homeobox domain and Homeodomain-like and Lambda repressor-like, DNA-binding domain and POU domain-containing protein [Strongyloides ratti]|uniref:POU domain protein n=1 Tax=Strongyloides ratti TaxID=34506 RepID=A0A090L2F8_STRRB|nr:POU-specific domain and Homeobox domain and Homeodomain-like and Lambda repressor-like, DNA-binding domain and POU domain-containing protein [Strongyloides ratti]CEF62272.1 POU-specific domain and Homeobox domain and Homeodomain-like and Lambda repressor-like, DNA-binding domain and POU domain-containing protein [Strongyloides ratti]
MIRVPSIKRIFLPVKNVTPFTKSGTLTRQNAVIAEAGTNFFENEDVKIDAENVGVISNVHGDVQKAINIFQELSNNISGVTTSKSGGISEILAKYNEPRFQYDKRGVVKSSLLRNKTVSIFKNFSDSKIDRCSFTEKVITVPAGDSTSPVCKQEVAEIITSDSSCSDLKIKEVHEAEQNKKEKSKSSQVKKTKRVRFAVDDNSAENESNRKKRKRMIKSEYVLSDKEKETEKGKENQSHEVSVDNRYQDSENSIIDKPAVKRKKTSFITINFFYLQLKKMASMVGEENEKMYGVEYYNGGPISQSISPSYDLPITNISITQQQQYTSFYSYSFGETNEGNSSLQIQNNNGYTDFSISKNSTQNDITSYTYQNYNQEIDGNQHNYYPTYYNQEYNINNSLDHKDLLPSYYSNNTFNCKIENESFMVSEVPSPQLIENNIHHNFDYNYQYSEMEDTSNYISSDNNSHQNQVINKECYFNKNYETKETFYDCIYTPELFEIINFFRSKKESLFGNNAPLSETVNNEIYTTPTIDPSVESIKVENTPKQQPEKVKEEVIAPNTNSSRDPHPPSEIYSSNISKQLQNEMIVENIEVFANNFKNLRISYGFTQGDVGRHIGLRFGSEFSQTTISRFEALNLSCKNMLKLKPKLEEWLVSTQKLFQQGYTSYEINEHNLHNKFPKPSLAEQEAREMFEIKKVRKLHTSGKNKKRRKRTNLELEQRNILYKKYLENNRPTEETLRKLANDANLDIDVVKIWFCNRRQKDRRIMTKKIKE